MALQKKVLENTSPNYLIFITIYQKTEFEVLFLPKVKLDFERSTFLFSGTKRFNEL